MSDPRAGSVVQESNRRGAVRISKPIEIHYSSGCPPIEARIADLSETGVFLDTHHPLPVGSRIEFSLPLPDGQEAPIKGTGRIVWVDAMVGVGVEFVALAERHRERLRMYVASVFFGVDSQ